MTVWFVVGAPRSILVLSSAQWAVGSEPSIQSSAYLDSYPNLLFESVQTICGDGFIRVSEVILCRRLNTATGGVRRRFVSFVCGWLKSRLVSTPRVTAYRSSGCVPRPAFSTASWSVRSCLVLACNTGSQGVLFLRPKNSRYCSTA